MRPTHIGILGLAAMLLATPAFAQQLIACVNTKNGGMRLVASPADCNASKETAVSWNVVGPQGPPGEPAPTPPKLMLLDSADVLIGEVVPGSWSVGGAAVIRPSGVYRLTEDGFGGGRSLIFRDPSCAGPVFTVSLDWPTENGTPFFPFETPVLNTDLKARVRADTSIADEEAISTVQLFIPDGAGGCQAWGGAWDAAIVFRLIERDDLGLFAAPFKVVEQ
jgi:hypothetical protein